MSLPIIRVEADKVDCVVSAAFQALVESHPGLHEHDSVPIALDWHNGAHWQYGIVRSEVRQALAEAALWVDVNGVPIDPPLGIVRAVIEWLLNLNMTGPEYITMSKVARMAPGDWDNHLETAKGWLGDSR